MAFRFETANERLAWYRSASFYDVSIKWNDPLKVNTEWLRALDEEEMLYAIYSLEGQGFTVLDANGNLLGGNQNSDVGVATVVEQKRPKL